MTFVFFHVGPGVTVPTIMVRSLRCQHPDAEIVQYTDDNSPAIEGVTEVRRRKGDVSKPILFRVECFADFNAPAVFLDTDMICFRPIDPDLGGNDIAICKREYDLGAAINLNAYGIDLSQYAGKSLGEIYPYVGCISICPDATFWNACLVRYAELPDQFQRWFGDQEAIRDVIATGDFTVRPLPERQYARLLDHDNDAWGATLLHFKGKKRKGWMLNAAIHFGLMTKAELRDAAA